MTLSFSDQISMQLQIDKKTTDKQDHWKSKGEIPLLTRKPFYMYKGSDIPDEEIITVKVDQRGAQQRNPFNALVCASTGVGKTRLIKNIVKGFWKQGYRILYIEPKGYEMVNAKKTPSADDCKRMHHLDLRESLPVVSYSPYYVKKNIEANYSHLMGLGKFYSPNIKILNYREIWQSFGIPDKASDIIIQMINYGITDVDAFIKKIYDKRTKLHFSTRNAAIAALENLKGVGFFGTNKKLNLKELWRKKKVVVINYYSTQGSFYMNTDIGILLMMVRDVAIEESQQGLDRVTKKLIIFDDATFYAGRSEKGDTVNLATLNIGNCQNNFRTWGVDTMFALQSPDPNAILPSLIDGCTTKFVSYVENPRSLRTKMPYDAYNLVANTNPMRPRLFITEENYTFQWIYVRGKTRWTTGFPFDCTVGHS